MTAVVLDTNVIVSGVLVSEGAPARILEPAYHGLLNLVFSPVTLAELNRVLRYPRILKAMKKRGLSLPDVTALIDRLRQFSILVSGELEIGDVVHDDPSDNVFLACAIEGEAEYVVSRDRHLLNVKRYRGIRIVSPAEFAQILGSSSANR